MNRFSLGLTALLVLSPLSGQLAAQSAAPGPSSTVATLHGLLPGPATLDDGALSATATELPDAPVPAIANPTLSGDRQAANKDPGGEPVVQAEQETQTAPPPSQNPAPPQAPSANAPPSLSDLGLAPSQVQGNAQQQALLDKRTHMLKVHQRLGLLTLIPLAATVVSSGGAKNDHGKGSGNTAGMDVHAAIGGVAVGMYVATAYYAIEAPRIPGTESLGAIRLHKALAWVHGPGMVLTPILGVLAFNQENNGEKVHGIASAHAPVAWATIAAYGAAIVSVSWPIKLHL